MKVTCLLVFCLISIGQLTNGILHIKRAQYYTKVWSSKDFPIGGGQVSIWTPWTFIQGYYPLGDVLSVKTDKYPGAVKALLVYDAQDGSVAAPVNVVVESSYGNAEKEKHRGFTLFKMEGPPGYHCPGYVGAAEYHFNQNYTAEFFQHYRCVHERYLKDDQSIKFFMSIVDMHGPSENYDRTFMWTFSTASDQPSDTKLFMSAYMNTVDIEVKPKNVYTLNSALLTFTNPLYNYEAPLLVYETREVKIVNTDHYPSFYSLNGDMCCLLGHYPMPLLFRVTVNPNYVRRRDEAAPLAVPTSFRLIDDGTYDYMELVCPDHYVALGDFYKLSEAILKRYARCVHERYVTGGHWLAIRTGLSKVGTDNKLTDLTLPTFFAKREDKSRAPLLRRSSVSIQAGSDVDKIVIANYDDIWKNIQRQKPDLLDSISFNSYDCDATQGAPLLVTTSNEKGGTVVQLTVNHLVETPFRLELPQFGTFIEAPTPGNPHPSFTVKKVIVSNQKLGIDEDIFSQTSIRYTLKYVVKVKTSNWQVDAVIHDLDGGRRQIKLNGFAVMKSYSHAESNSVKYAEKKELSSDAPVLSFNWFTAVVLLFIFHLH